MSKLFGSCRGTFVVMEESDQSVPGRIVLEGFEPMASIVIAPEVSNKVNAQFQTSLRRSVYVNVFGDQMGDVVIRGQAFAARCSGADSGMKDVFDYYQNYRASERKEPVTVTFGDKSISGFLMGMTLSPRDANFIILDFTMSIASLPDKAA